MSERQEFDLLIDIAKLLKKYGPDAFEKLSQVMSSSESSERLASILTATVKAARELKNGGARQSRRGVRASLAELANAEPEKSGLLCRLYDDLKAKKFLPALRDCQAFAAGNGLPLVESATRNKAVDSLIEAAIPLPKDRVEALVASLRADALHDDRSLEGWTRIILDQEHRPKKAAQ